MAVVVGGGVTGLAAAYELSKKGIEVTVVEKEKQLGGVLGSFSVGGYEIEKFYHHVFRGDRHFFGMCRELGLSGLLEWKNTRTGFYSKGRFYNLSGAVHLMMFGLLSLADRMKLASFALRLKAISKKEIESMDNVSASQWIRENLGENIYSNFFEPLLASKYGEDLDDVSAAWFVERMRMRSTRGLTGEKLCYMKGGFHSFVEKLAEKIQENNGKIITGASARKVIVKGGRVAGFSHSKGKLKCSSVISTVPVRDMIRLSGISGQYARKAAGLEYQGAVSVLLGTDARLTDYYWTNMIDKGFAFGAAIEHTNFMPSSDYIGCSIIYLASYPGKNSRIWKMSEKEIFKAYFNDLKKMLPDKKISVKWWKVAIEKNAGIVYRKGVLTGIPGFETPVRGLYAGGMFNSYPDRNLNESVRIGKECARLASEIESGE